MSKTKMALATIINRRPSKVPYAEWQEVEAGFWKLAVAGKYSVSHPAIVGDAGMDPTKPWRVRMYPYADNSGSELLEETFFTVEDAMHIAEMLYLTGA
jgi:hypothetical protein